MCMARRWSTTKQHSHFRHAAQRSQIFGVAGCIDAGQLGGFFVNRAGDQRVEFFVETKVHSGADVVQCSSSAGHIDFAQSDLGKLDVLEIQNLQVCCLRGCVGRPVYGAEPRSGARRSA